jgi:hypothetical protein
MLSECVMILISFWTNQLLGSISMQPVRPVNTTLLCRVVPTQFADVSTTHSVLDRRVYAPTFKIHCELVLLKMGLTRTSAEVFIFRTFSFGANE